MKVLYKNYIYEAVKKTAGKKKKDVNPAANGTAPLPSQIQKTAKGIFMTPEDIRSMKTNHGLFESFVYALKDWIGGTANKLAFKYSSDINEWKTWLTSALWDRVSKIKDGQDLTVGHILSGAILIARNAYAQAHMTRQKAPLAQALPKAQKDWESWVLTILNEDLKESVAAGSGVDSISLEDCKLALKYIATKYTDMVKTSAPNLRDTLADATLYPRFTKYYKDILIPNIANKLSTTTTSDSDLWESYLESMIGDEVEGVMVANNIKPEADPEEWEDTAKENSRKNASKAVFRRNDGLASSLDAPTPGGDESEGMQIADQGASSPNEEAEKNSNLKLLTDALSEEEMYILKAKLDGESLKDIAKEFGISGTALTNKWNKIFSQHKTLFRKLVPADLLNQLMSDNENRTVPSAAMRELRESLGTISTFCIFESVTGRVHFFN